MKPRVDANRHRRGLPPAPDAPPQGYDRLNLGTTAYDRANLLAKLTGHPAEVRSIPTARDGHRALLEAFARQLDDDKPVLVGTRPHRPTAAPFPNDLYPSHAYEVVSVSNGRIELRNPWGVNHPQPMTTRQFWEYFLRDTFGIGKNGEYSTLK